MVLIRSLLRREGIRVPSAGGEVFARRVQDLGLPVLLAAEVAPLLALLTPLNEQIRSLDQHLARVVASNETAKRLTTVPGVGAVTAVSFLATLDQAVVFKAHTRWRATLGWCPWNGAPAKLSAEVHHEGR
jgi:transposase